MRQQAHQQDAVQPFLDRNVCGKLGGHHGGGFVVGPLRAGVHGHHISIRRKLGGGGGHAGGGERQKGQRPVVFSVQRAGVGVPGLHPNASHRRINGKVRSVSGIFNPQYFVGHRCGSLVHLHRGDVRTPFGKVQKRHAQPGGCSKLLGSSGPVHRYRPIRVVRHPRLRRVQPTDPHHNGLNIVDGPPRDVRHHQPAVFGFEGERVGEQVVRMWIFEFVAPPVVGGHRPLRGRPGCEGRPGGISVSSGGVYAREGFGVAPAAHRYGLSVKAHDGQQQCRAQCESEASER